MMRAWATATIRAGKPAPLSWTLLTLASPNGHHDVHDVGWAQKSNMEHSFENGVLYCAFDLPLAVPGPAVVVNGGPTRIDANLTLLLAWGNYGRHSFHVGRLLCNIAAI